MFLNDQEAREVIGFYAVWACLICLITLLIRPFISMKQMVRDFAITFLFSFLCGLVLEYFDMPVPVKCGISGTVGMFAIFLYEIAIKLLKNVEQNPAKYLSKLKRK